MLYNTAHLDPGPPFTPCKYLLRGFLLASFTGLNSFSCSGLLFSVIAVLMLPYLSISCLLNDRVRCQDLSLEQQCLLHVELPIVRKYHIFALSSFSECFTRYFLYSICSNERWLITNAVVPNQYHRFLLNPLHPILFASSLLA
jgi:hypothetical protein